MRAIRTSARRYSSMAGWATVAMMILAAATSLVVPTLRWRAQVVFMMATGQIPDIEWHDLITFLFPSSEQPIARLIDTRNPYAVIHNPHSSPADVSAGAVIFRDQCMACHE